MSSWADQLFTFYTSLRPTVALPNGIQWLYPQKEPAVMETVRVFLQTYFNDNRPRRLLLGINPGRLGAGITGVNFTAPKQLTEDCGIDHPFGTGSELSAEFIYRVIQAYGGPRAFYQDFFIGSVCPLGFVKEGLNINYYDDKALQKAVEPFIIHCINQQCLLPIERTVCFCIGGDKNYTYLHSLNSRFRWFETIEALPHPRFVMQYRRKTMEAFVQQYLAALQKKP